jgi:hypothetical protein
MSEEQIPVETPVETTDTVEQPVILNNEGNFNSEWLQGLPDELGNHSIWSKYNNPVDLAKGAINAQKMIGGKLDDFLSSQDANDIAKRNELLGIPKSAEDYNFSLDVPENIELPEGRITEFKELAHSLGISNKAAEELIKFDIEKAGQDLQQSDLDYEAEVQNAESELREVWKGDTFEYNMSKVAEVMEFLDLGDMMDDPAIGNNTKLIQAIYNKFVPLLDNDTLIEAKNNDNFASIKDQLDDVDRQLMEYEGNTGETGYQKLLEQKSILLNQYAELRG